MAGPKTKTISNTQQTKRGYTYRISAYLTNHKCLFPTIQANIIFASQHFVCISNDRFMYSLGALNLPLHEFSQIYYVIQFSFDLVSYTYLCDFRFYFFSGKRHFL